MIISVKRGLYFGLYRRTSAKNRVPSPIDTGTAIPVRRLPGARAREVVSRTRCARLSDSIVRTQRTLLFNITHYNVWIYSMDKTESPAVPGAVKGAEHRRPLVQL